MTDAQSSESNPLAPGRCHRSAGDAGRCRRRWPRPSRIADQGDALSMDPHSLNESLQLELHGNIYEPLVGRDKQLELVAGLATVLEADLADGLALRRCARA